jgi:hypothetical protein
MRIIHLKRILFRPIRYYFIDTPRIERVINLDKPHDIRLPTSHPKIWILAGSFKNKVEAIDYVMEHYGADKHGNINILSVK